MSRKSARELLFKMVFETLFIEPSKTDTYDKFIKDETIEEDNRNFISENYSSIMKNNENLISVITSSLTDAFPIDRIFKIDLAILLVATNELVNYKETPVKVVVNEAVELSKKYSTDKSYSFINGVLAKIIKNIE